MPGTDSLPRACDKIPPCLQVMDEYIYNVLGRTQISAMHSKNL